MLKRDAGVSLPQDPTANKGTAFTPEERLGLCVERRTVLATGTAVAASLSLAPGMAMAREPAAMRTVPQLRDITLSVNGTDHAVRLDSG